MAHPHWYTPAPLVARIRRALGGVIDLDPCAAHPSLDTVKALRTYLYPRQDGLKLPWRGRVFSNPPYDREGIRAFTDRALHQEPSCERLLMLVPLRPSASWWRDLARSADDCVLLLRRIAFIDGSASPKPGTTGRGELCIFGWRLAEVEALGGIVLPRVMQGAPLLHERVVQETLFESTFSAQSAAVVPRLGMETDA